MLTTRVMRNSTRPEAMSALMPMSPAKPYCSAMFAAKRVAARFEDVPAGHVARREDEGDSDGLAQGAPQAEHRGADDARTCRTAAPPSA